MNTLYEILEVSENASKEVIEKAYRVLAKKYHPDVQTPENKMTAETKMKEINEAYSILSDDSKRMAYDEELKSQREIEKSQEQEKANTEQMSNTVKEPYNNTNQPQMSSGQKEMSQEERRYKDMQRRRYEEELRKQQERMCQQMQQEYENAYYNYLRSLGYRIKERWTWEKTKKLLLTLSIIAVIIAVLWFLPPTHDMMVNFYESNKLLKIIIDIIIGIVVAIFKAIGSVFSSLFVST